MQTYQTYFKREFDKKRENSGVLARFVLFLAGMAFYLNGLMAIIGEWIKRDCEDLIEKIVGVMQDCVQKPKK